MSTPPTQNVKANPTDCVLYTGARPSRAFPPPASFKDLKLYLVPALLSLVNYACPTSPWFVSTIAPLFGFYVMATALHAIVPVDEFLGLTQLTIKKTIPFMPPVEYGFYITRDIRTKRQNLFNILNGMFQRSETQGQYVYLGPLTKEKYEELCDQPFVDLESNAPRRYASLQAFETIPLLNGIVALFFAFNEIMDPNLGFLWPGSYGLVGTPANAGKQYVISTTGIGGSGTISTSKISFAAEDGSTQVARHTSGLHGVPCVSSLKGVKMTASYGLPASAPEGKAILVPFFFDLLQRDQAFVPSIIRRFFYRYLGPSEDYAQTAMAVIQEVWESLSDTPYGRTYTHLMMGISWALECGRKIYVVHDEAMQYSGFILYLDKPMKYLGDEFNPAPYSDWYLRLDVFETLLSVKRGICAILSAMELHNGSLITLTVEMVSTPWAIAMELHKRNIHSVDTGSLAKLQRLLNRIPGESFKKCDYNNLLAMFDFILGKPATGYDVDTPMCFDNVLASGNVDRIALALMAFGPQAPTWSKPQEPGDVIQLPTDATRIYEKVATEGKFSTFPVGFTALGTAITDLRRVARERSIFLKRTAKGTALKCTMHYTGEDDCKILWAALVNFVSEQKVVEEVIAPAKGKRKADDEENIEHRGKRVRKRLGFLNVGAEGMDVDA